VVAGVSERLVDVFGDDAVPVEVGRDDAVGVVGV
jgi:hypothetical protein